jgi:hypothetical protein
MISPQRLIVCCIFFALSAEPLATRADTAAPNDQPVTLLSSRWRIEISPRTGCVETISDALDHAMNWVHAGRPWGAVRFRTNNNVLVFDHPESIESTTPGACDSTYSSAALELKVHRAFAERGSFEESYTLHNTGHSVISLASAAACITVPFNDSCKDGTPKCLTNNCNAHLWAGGSSSWAGKLVSEKVGCRGCDLTQDLFDRDIRVLVEKAGGKGCTAC